MKFGSMLLAVGTLCCAPAFGADRIAIDVGPGRHWSDGSGAIFVRYIGDHTIPNFPNQPAFYEWSLGSWEGEHDNSALGLSLGTQWFLDGFHLDFSGGAAVLAHKTALSGTHQQFIVRFGGGYQTGKFGIGIYQTHYSNAKLLFDWNGRNLGYDFFTFQVSYELE